MPDFEVGTPNGVRQKWEWLKANCSKPELIPLWEFKLRNPEPETLAKIATELIELWGDAFADFPLEVTQSVLSLLFLSALSLSTLS